VSISRLFANLFKLAGERERSGSLENKNGAKIYNKHGIHLFFTSSRITSSDANLPIFFKKNIDRSVKGSFGMAGRTFKCSTAHYNVPRYRNSITHGIIWPLDVLILLHLTSHRGPMRIQQDFFSFMFMSNQLSSTAQASNNSCNSLTEGAINKMSPTYSTTYTDISTYFYMSYSIGSTVSLHDDERDLLVIAKFLDLVL